jgi:hypothetical protein
VDEWMVSARARIAAASGLSPGELELAVADERTLLDLARIAAHESGERTNAPLLCYLIGRASRETELEKLADAVRNE